MSVDDPDGCLTFRSNTFAGHIYSAVLLIAGVGMLVGSWRLRGEQNVAAAVLCLLAGLFLVLVGAVLLASRPDTYIFDRAMGLLTVRAGTLWSMTDRRYPLSDIKGVKLIITNGMVYQVQLAMLPCDAPQSEVKHIDLAWGLGNKRNWEAKGQVLAFFLGLQLDVQDVRWD